MIVTEADFERCLDVVRNAPAVRGDGVFGPDSMMWQVHREAALFLGAGRALLLQLAHPWVAAGVADQSQVFTNPLGRFHRTFSTVYTMVFGTRDQALGVARRLYWRHGAVVGTLPEAAGTFAAGSAYSANEVNALRWVHATLVETAMLSHDLVLPALSDAQRERYWVETRLFAGLFGIPQQELSADWASFQEYATGMAQSDVLSVSPAAREIARRIFSGDATWVGPPRWFRALTAQMLPERLRTAFDLPFGEPERRSVERAQIWLRRAYPMLPDRLRTVGPYQEACARARGEGGPGAVTRVLNRAWIGRPSMGTPAVPSRPKSAPP
jgi:uncharacterized protein (DUF2236 family)